MHFKQTKIILTIFILRGSGTSRTFLSPEDGLPRRSTVELQIHIMQPIFTDRLHLLCKNIINTLS